MKQAYIKLHLSILLAGFTGIFGKLITLNEGLLVWYRVMMASLLLLVILKVSKRWHSIAWRDILKIVGVGSILVTHWLFFYASIKSSSVSIGVICFSMTGFFTAILDPLINRRKILFQEVFLSLIAIVGIALIFHFDVHHRVGILLGTISSLFASLFVIANKRVGASQPSGMMLFYEMVGGFVYLSILLPFYLHLFPVDTIVPSHQDLIYLVLFVFFCTIMMCLLQIEALKQISPFTVNLSFNLEPIYSIILAIIIFNESEDFTLSFYVGLAMIFSSVLLQMFVEMRNSRRASHLSEDTAS